MVNGLEWVKRMDGMKNVMAVKLQYDRQWMVKLVKIKGLNSGNNQYHKTIQIEKAMPVYSIAFPGHWFTIIYKSINSGRLLPIPQQYDDLIR